MNVYHITCSPQVRIAYLHFWGCNLDCRACLLKKELYDCHLAEIKNDIFNTTKRASVTPERFLSLKEVTKALAGFEIKEVIFMGAEPATDPELPALAAALHKKFNSYNILLTNGFALANHTDIDELVFSLKAYTDELHRDYTGKPNASVLENFVTYYRLGLKMRSESIFIPEYIDCSEIEKISRFIASVDPNIPYRIDSYIPINDNPWRRATREEIKRASLAARKNLVSVTYLTGNETLKYEVLRVI